MIPLDDLPEAHWDGRYQQCNMASATEYVISLHVCLAAHEVYPQGVKLLLEKFKICTTRRILGCQADAAARHEIAECCTGLGPAVKLVNMPLPRLFLRTVLWHSQIFTNTLSTSREAYMAYKTKMP